LIEQSAAKWNEKLLCVVSEYRKGRDTVGWHGEPIGATGVRVWLRGGVAKTEIVSEKGMLKNGNGGGILTGWLTAVIC